jgi:hypothetical protein
LAKLGILAQLVVHFPIMKEGISNGGLVAYIYCMVLTIEFFNFSYAS